METVEDVSETMVSGQGLKNAIVMKPAEFIIKMSSPTSDPVTAVAETPTGLVHYCACSVLTSHSQPALFLVSSIIHWKQ